MFSYLNQYGKRYNQSWVIGKKCRQLAPVTGSWVKSWDWNAVTLLWTSEEDPK